MSLAQDERTALVNTLVAVGADAPTLCGGWTARDLAAHLVVRERRLDAAPGILLSPLAGYTDKVQRQYASKPWLELVDSVRSGPPIWSPFALLDPLVNLGEMFVHHEDLRRAQPEWTRRELGDDVEKKLWPTVRMIGSRAYRGSKVAVHIGTPDGRSATVKKGVEPGVTLIAPASELLLHAFGRDAVEIDFAGDAADVEALTELDRSF